MIKPADGLAFFISAIIEILSLFSFFFILSLKLIKDLFSSIFSFRLSIDNDFSKAVCLNAAAGLLVNETHQNFTDAYNNAREHILSNKVIKHLEKIQNA